MDLVRHCVDLCPAVLVDVRPVRTANTSVLATKADKLVEQSAQR